MVLQLSREHGPQAAEGLEALDLDIIIVDHNLDLALALSDSTVALERGAVTWTGESRLLREDLDLRRKVLWL